MNTYKQNNIQKKSFHSSMQDQTFNNWTKPKQLSQHQEPDSDPADYSSPIQFWF